MPHAGGDHHLVFFVERGEPGPDARLSQVADLGLHEFGQPLVLDDRPGDEPGKRARRQHIQPYQGVIEWQPYRDKENDIGYRNPGEYGEPVDWQRHGQPEVIQLVQPLFYSPYIRISRQVH
jgi:hypothetical protein